MPNIKLHKFNDKRNGEEESYVEVTDPVNVVSQLYPRNRGCGELLSCATSDIDSRVHELDI